jgi:ribosomal protein S18 acetylase RimI-like enzyme
MEIKRNSISASDSKKAVQYAIQGMHFNWYTDSKILLNLYAKYFWYLEINKSTQILSAYKNNQFVGVLLANMKGEKKVHSNKLEKLYVSFINFIQNTLLKDSSGLYEQTINKQLKHYLENDNPDGEILFLAADPNCKVKGIGTKLLQEFEQIEKGKQIYLYTDDACTYQFYEHRDFTLKEDDTITMNLPKGDIKLRCFLYDKVL